MVSHAIVRKNTAKTVPKEQHTAAYRLFHYGRRCLVQQMFTIDEEHARLWGTLTTGDDRLDREMRTAWVPVVMTVPAMCDIIDRGGSVVFEDTTIATQTYLDIVEHLRNWVEIFYTDPGIADAPLNDLKKMDELAGEIFRYASPQLMPKEEDSGYGSFIAKMRRGGRISLDVRRDHNNMLVAPPVRKQHYQPLSDKIAQLVFNRQKGVDNGPR